MGAHASHCGRLLWLIVGQHGGCAIQDRVCNCLVLGAGIAGLAAARALAEAGRRVLVLEARQRAGGRLLTQYLPGEATPIELGAEFVHGRPPELLALLAEAGLASYETSGADWRFTGGELRESGEEDGAAFALLDELDAAAPDRSFAEWLAERRPPEADARRARQYVEGFNAADAGRIGTVGLARQQAAEASIEGDRAWRLTDGYTALAEYLHGRVLAAGGGVVLGEPVVEVRWERGRVVLLSAREEYVARTAVVTLPVGVLQGGAVRFVPEPAETLAAARSLASGPVTRLVLRFRRRFWEEQAPGMRFLFGDAGEGALPSTWWTTAPRESTLLVGWAGGPRALAMPGAEEWVASGLRSLEGVFGLGVGALDAELVSWHTHDWQRDPYSLGGYSYAPSGAADAPETLARPVAGTLFFAGEHTDTSGHPGTVHGALRSGLRAAGQVLGVLAGAAN